jgi:hypothetical protein
MDVIDRHHNMEAPCRLDAQSECQSEALRHRRLIAEWSSSPAAEGFDDRISAALVPSLWALYGDSDDEVHSHLVQFFDENRDHLLFVSQQHADDRQVAPLLHQPELPLILDRLEADPTGLLEVWPLTVPRVWLEALADAWGSPL